MVLVNFYRHYDDYVKHVKLHVSMGAPWEISKAEEKVASVFAAAEEVDMVMPYYWVKSKIMRIPVRLVVGTPDKEFPQIYDHNHKYFKVYRDSGIDVTLTEVENQDHYDLILNADLSLTKIREFEISQIDSNNEFSNLLYMESPETRDMYYEMLKNPIWRYNCGETLNEAREKTIQRFRIINNIIKKNDHTENYRKLFTIYETFAIAN